MRRYRMFLESLKKYTADTDEEMPVIDDGMRASADCLDYDLANARSAFCSHRQD